MGYECAPRGSGRNLRIEKKNFWGQAKFSKKGKNLSHFVTGSHKIVTGSHKIVTESHKIVTGSHKIVTGKIVTGTARLPKVRP